MALYKLVFNLGGEVQEWPRAFSCWWILPVLRWDVTFSEKLYTLYASVEGYLFDLARGM